MFDHVTQPQHENDTLCVLKLFQTFMRTKLYLFLPWIDFNFALQSLNCVIQTREKSVQKESLKHVFMYSHYFDQIKLYVFP